jgi:hypothetical protein
LRNKRENNDIIDLRSIWEPRILHARQGQHQQEHTAWRSCLPPMRDPKIPMRDMRNSFLALLRMVEN